MNGKIKKPIRIILLFVLSISIILSLTISVCAAGKEHIVDIYLFWGDGCSHCAAERPFLQELQQQYGDKMVLHEYELWYHPENTALVEQFAAAYGFEPSGVPMTFIGEQYWIGFSDERKPELIQAIENGIQNGVPDAMDIANGTVKIGDAAAASTSIINVPIFGEVDLKNQSVIISTLIISFVDGVNPCSLWVLSMLLAMVVHTESRKKTLIIGAVFLTVTSLIYMLFILGVFTALSYVSYLVWIRIVVAVLTLILGLINLKDYFFFKEGVSLTIDDTKKPGLYKRMRNVINHSDNFWAMIGATIVLAAGVSLVEFSCTAAFPVVWSNILVSHEVTTITFILLLLVYMFIYQLDEMVIFGAAVITMKSKRMEEKHGRVLKLFSGILMVVLSLVMIINADLMNDLGTTLLIFALAILLTLFILLLTSQILPRFGIYIGHTTAPKETMNQKESKTQSKTKTKGKE